MCSGQQVCVGGLEMNIVVFQIPTYAAECDAPSADSGPRILSPQSGQIALLIRGVAAEKQEIPLEADTASNGTIMWFVNGTYLGETDSDERMWWVPEIGTHEVVAMDHVAHPQRERLRCAKKAVMVFRR